MIAKILQNIIYYDDAPSEMKKSKPASTRMEIFRLSRLYLRYYHIII